MSKPAITYTNKRVQCTNTTRNTSDPYGKQNLAFFNIRTKYIQSRKSKIIKVSIGFRPKNSAQK